MHFFYKREQTVLGAQTADSDGGRGRRRRRRGKTGGEKNSTMERSRTNKGSRRVFFFLLDSRIEAQLPPDTDCLR